MVLVLLSEYCCSRSETVKRHLPGTKYLSLIFGGSLIPRITLGNGFIRVLSSPDPRKLSMCYIFRHWLRPWIYGMWVRLRQIEIWHSWDRNDKLLVTLFWNVVYLWITTRFVLLVGPFSHPVRQALFRSKSYSADTVLVGFPDRK